MASEGLVASFKLFCLRIISTISKGLVGITELSSSALVELSISNFPNNSSKTNFPKLLEQLDLKDNYFSVRGELVFVNNKKKEIVIKIKSFSNLKNLKNKNFKLVIKGELSLKLLNSFVSLDVIRDGNTLKLLNYEVIEINLSKDN